MPVVGYCTTLEVLGHFLYPVSSFVYKEHQISVPQLNLVDDNNLYAVVDLLSIHFSGDKLANLCLVAPTTLH